MSQLTAFWFRRDLRLADNSGLYHALKENSDVLPVFIFDSTILSKLTDNRDLRVQFIYKTLEDLKSQLRSLGADLVVRHGNPLDVWKELVRDYKITRVYTNSDYEPYAVSRDKEVESWLSKNGVAFSSYKDQCLFEKDEILSGTVSPYTVYTPYKKKVLSILTSKMLQPWGSEELLKNLHRSKKIETFPSLKDLGFEKTNFKFPSLKIEKKILDDYAKTRDYPALVNGTSHLGLHLRFGTLSVRQAARAAFKDSPVWLSELIWRDFFMQILWHFPHVAKGAFRPQYDAIPWRKSKEDFEKWCAGRTGYPLVDAGMRELNSTGYMHNRVRMVAASFLTKHLLIDWREGEKYFAQKLLDFDLSANNGNWQWVAGSGCDAAPYFRIFNPETQIKKFDPEFKYIKKWVPEFGTEQYPLPMVDHVEARARCLKAFTETLTGKKK